MISFSSLVNLTRQIEEIKSVLQYLVQIMFSKQQNQSPSILKTNELRKESAAKNNNNNHVAH